MTVTFLNIDCMDYLAQCPDKHFDLAVVDPPYGLGDRLRGGNVHMKFITKGSLDWDVVPTEKYFTELFRVSKNQVIWGGNYFDLPPTRGFLVWDKQQSLPNFSACEYAWTSFDCVAKIFKYTQSGCFGEDKIHPHQKPVRMYKWIYEQFTTPGQRILDTHLGSGSSAIAAHYTGLEFVGCELDEHYHNVALQRFKEETKQLEIFGSSINA